MPMREGRADERMEERVRRERLRFEFRMELASQKPRVVRGLDNLHVLAVGRSSGDAESGVGQRLFVFAVEFVAVAVAFADIGCAVGAEGRGILFDLAGPPPSRIVPPISSTPRSSRSL